LDEACVQLIKYLKFPKISLLLQQKQYYRQLFENEKGFMEGNRFKA
jgi:hypothetical protein